MEQWRNFDHQYFRQQSVAAQLAEEHAATEQLRRQPLSRPTPQPIPLQHPLTTEQHSSDQTSEDKVDLHSSTVVVDDPPVMVQEHRRRRESGPDTLTRSLKSAHDSDVELGALLNRKIEVFHSDSLHKLDQPSGDGLVELSSTGELSSQDERRDGARHGGQGARERRSSSRRTKAALLDALAVAAELRVQVHRLSSASTDGAPPSQPTDEVGESDAVYPYAPPGFEHMSAKAAPETHYVSAKSERALVRRRTSLDTVIDLSEKQLPDSPVVEKYIIPSRRDALPSYSGWRSKSSNEATNTMSIKDEATINLKHDVEYSPQHRGPYKMPMEELRRFRERIETLPMLKEAAEGTPTSRTVGILKGAASSASTSSNNSKQPAGNMLTGSSSSGAGQPKPEEDDDVTDAEKDEDDDDDDGEDPLPSGGGDPSTFRSVQVLVVTSGGESLWTATRVVSRTGATSSLCLPSLHLDMEGMRCALRVLSRLGLSPTQYICSGGVHYPRVYPLVDSAIESYAIMVERIPADTAMATARACRHREFIQASWERCPARPSLGHYLETELDRFGEAGLQAWVELCSAPWYITARQVVPDPRAANLSYQPTEVLQSPGSATPTTRVHFSPTTVFPAPSVPSSTNGTRVGAAPFIPFGGYVDPAPAGMVRAPTIPSPYAGVDPRHVRNEAGQLKDVYRIISRMSSFPNTEWTGAARSPLDELESFSLEVTELVDSYSVQTALGSLTCRDEFQGEPLLRLSTLLWKVMESRLGKSQQQYLKEMAPGGCAGTRWKERYDNLNRFFGDTAKSVDITLHEMRQLKPNLQKTVQHLNETAGAFYTRLNTRFDTVNFCAAVVQGCGPITPLELLQLFEVGLRDSAKVGSRLLDLGLDTSHPEVWEEEQRSLQRDCTSAILKVREVATAMEAQQLKDGAELAKVVALEMQNAAQRTRLSTSTFPRTAMSTSSTRTNIVRDRWRPRGPVAAVSVAANTGSGQVAAVAPNRSSVAGGSAPTTFPPSRPRLCFACKSPNHMVANCDDPVKFAAWKAAAPHRMSMKAPQVAVCMAVLSEEQPADVLTEEESEMLAEIAALVDLDVDVVDELCVLCNVQAGTDTPFQGGGLAGVPGSE